MTDERLLARLRGRGNKDTIAAADRIEALTAERDEARVAINQIGKCIGVLGAVQCVGDIVVEAEKRFSRLAKAVELLKEARQDLEEYVTHEWPKDEHPVYERKWERDMELCRRIDAALAEIEGEKE